MHTGAITIEILDDFENKTLIAELISGDCANGGRYTLEILCLLGKTIGPWRQDEMVTTRTESFAEMRSDRELFPARLEAYENDTYF